MSGDTEPELAAGRGSPVPARFDIGPEDAKLRRATRAITEGAIVGVGTILLAGAALVALGLYYGNLIVVVLGAVVTVFGALFTRAMARALTLHFDAVLVDHAGITVVPRGRARLRATWSNPELRFLLADHTDDAVRSQRAYRDIPCQLFCGQVHVGLSRAAFDAIRATAAREHVAIEELPLDSGTRRVRVGIGPEFGTPFHPID